MKNYQLKISGNDTEGHLVSALYSLLSAVSHNGGKFEGLVFTDDVLKVEITED